MDLIILVALIILVLFFFRKFSNFVYLIGICEVFLRLVHFIKSQLNIEEFTEFINKYIPSSLEVIINRYSTGVFSEILVWGLIVIMCIFVSYLVRNFFERR